MKDLCAICDMLMEMGDEPFTPGMEICESCARKQRLGYRLARALRELLKELKNKFRAF